MGERGVNRTGAQIRNLTTVLAVVLASSAALAQSSDSYKLREQTFNASGHPADGEVMTSASFRITIDSIGDGIAGIGMSSASFHLDASFIVAYPPPGEVLGLRFSDQETLTWDPEKSVGTYNLYRDLLTSLAGLNYGDCEQHGLEATTAVDKTDPPTADGLFYLVTAKNRLFEEGTKGWDSSGASRPNPFPCP